jgi:hypothetical protein
MGPLYSLDLHIFPNGKYSILCTETVTYHIFKKFNLMQGIVAVEFQQYVTLLSDLIHSFILFSIYHYPSIISELNDFLRCYNVIQLFITPP